MATYESIATNWFYLRHLKSFGSFEAFEAEPAIEDRLGSRRVMARMLEEAPVTARSLFSLSDFALDFESLKSLDVHITAGEAEWWMKKSDPDDPNNYFKLTLSEFAVHLG